MAATMAPERACVGRFLGAVRFTVIKFSPGLWTPQFPDAHF